MPTPLLKDQDTVDKENQQLANLISGVRQDLQLIGDKILSNQEKFMALLDDILSKVKAEGDVVDSVIVLLNGLQQKLDSAIANGADPDKLQQISDAIGAQTGKLSAAVAANTPAASTAPATPAPDQSPAGSQPPGTVSNPDTGASNPPADANVGATPPVGSDVAPGSDSSTPTADSSLQTGVPSGPPVDDGSTRSN